MSTLVLGSLHVQGFRCFKNLRLEGLRRANLIVGKNNVGKTYLLEAIRLYISRGAPWLLRQMVVERNEAPGRGSDTPMPEDLHAWVRAFENIFYGRQSLGVDVESLRVGPVGVEDLAIEVALAWYVERVGEDGRRILRAVLLSADEAQEGDDLRPALVIRAGGQQTALIPLDQTPDPMRSSALLYGRHGNGFSPLAPCQFVSSGGPDDWEIAHLWDRIALTDLEDAVTAALRLVEPRIERITLVGQGVGARRERSVLVKLTGQDRRVTLRSMGEGINRLFGLMLALVNARDGVLLVDEIENGLHYTVLPSLWRLILATAEELNIQVFATTHSWDCIKAFQAATVQENQVDVNVIRLESGETGLRAVVFSKDELDILADEEIEVR